MRALSSDHIPMNIMTIHLMNIFHKIKKILALSFAIITGFMIVEFIGGYWFNSLALMLMRDTWQMIVYRYF